ncbi:TPA: phage virion morphogenesis protein [Candidatus Gastranaerophilales bacterium HUM_19]|nr:MAG TPA: phage virion morphogenesis protein [Candidatus Gastranaerophilales bacterium HUM_19]DAB25958.1 MAG TPA: phage virion morphogenesis protein [Candidatus Gastranaerophilales bacterium HUM_23]
MLQQLCYKYLQIVFLKTQILSSLKQNLLPYDLLFRCRIHYSKDIKYQDKLLLITKELNKKKKGWNGLSRLLSPISTFYDNDSAVIGSNLDYAAIHQLGGQAGKNQSVTIPTRPYLQLRNDDFEEILNMTERFLRK